MKGIYRDRQNRLRASADTFPPILADFLETDVRENRTWCEHLLAGLVGAAIGEPFCAVGNLYVLSADAQGALIRNTQEERAPALGLPLDELKGVLVAWSLAMQAPSG